MVAEKAGKHLLKILNFLKCYRPNRNDENAFEKCFVKVLKTCLCFLCSPKLSAMGNHTNNTFITFGQTFVKYFTKKVHIETSFSERTRSSILYYAF